MSILSSPEAPSQAQQSARVAIYARISYDKNGQELGVTNRLEDARAEAARRGWAVVEEYVDNDLSAYSGVPALGTPRS